MPLVFVHGVNVRTGKAYEKELAQRNQYFCNIFYKLLGHEFDVADIISPYWGDLATNITEGSPFLPPKGIGLSKSTNESKAQKKGETEEHLEPDDLPDEQASLVELAQGGSLNHVLDMVLASASEQAEHTNEQAQQLSKLGLRALQLNRQYENNDKTLDWLENVQDDEELLRRLQQELQQGSPESTENRSTLNHFHNAARWLKENYGTTEGAKQRLKLRREQMRTSIQGMVKTAKTQTKLIGNVRRNAASHVAAAAITGPMRRFVHEKLFLFVGDSFLYFGQRGTPQSPGPIVQRVSTALEEGWKKKNESEKRAPLIVVAHSMGGNIMADLVSHFRPDLEIDILITVASQFPLFADLHMFPGLNTRERPILKPSNVKRWINFYDVNDVFGFTAGKMFEDVEDVDFASGRFGIATHADCFKFVSLYELMAVAVSGNKLAALL